MSRPVDNGAGATPPLGEDLDMTTESRRRFLTHAWVAALAPLAARLPGITPAQRRQSAVFPEGIAAQQHGDTTVLITRIASSEVGVASVTWAVARDPRMRSVVIGGRTAAKAETGWSVRVDAPGLPEAASYWFQFRALGVTSAVGRIDGRGTDASA